MTEKFEIKNRWTGKVQFTAEIDCAPHAPKSWKLRLAVLWGIKNGSNLSGANLIDADLTRANLSGCDLSYCDLGGSDLGYCDLRGSDMRNCNLIGADLTRANLIGADLTRANLRDCDLIGANLIDADLTRANLSGCDLSYCDLGGSDLRGANLRGADLSRSNLSGCALSGSDIRGSKFDFEVATPDRAAPRIAAVAKAALANEDALNMRVWHSCETTHCIAGWAIHLAGEQGKALEGEFGSYIAGLSLLGAEAASHFYDSKADATAWLRGELEAEV